MKTETDFSSAAVIIHTKPLKRLAGTHVLFVEQLDQPGSPLGLPGGHRNGKESAVSTAQRETFEETGVFIPDAGLDQVGIIRQPFQPYKKPKVIFSHLMSFEGIMQLGDWNYGFALTRMAEHPYRRLDNPPGRSADTECGALYLLSWVHLIAGQKFSAPLNLYRPDLLRLIARLLPPS